MRWGDYLACSWCWPIAAGGAVTAAAKARVSTRIYAPCVSRDDAGQPHIVEAHKCLPGDDDNVM